MNEDIINLKKFLSKDELEFFNSLANGYQKNLAKTAFSGKQVETQQKNLREVKEALKLECKTIFDYKKKINPRPEANPDLTNDDKLELYFNKIPDEENKKSIKDLYYGLIKKTPTLEARYAWNQPMLVNNGTFILAFSVATNHFSLGLDSEALIFFEDEIAKNDYELMKKGFKIKWLQNINVQLIEEIITFTISKKKNAKGFWD